MKVELGGDTIESDYIYKEFRDSKNNWPSWVIADEDGYTVLFADYTREDVKEKDTAINNYEKGKKYLQNSISTMEEAYNNLQTEDNKNMDALLISAFPATGKSHFYRTYKDDMVVFDSDSSTFDKSEFPQNYIEHIKDKKDEADIIFISSHKEVRDALLEAGLDFTVVYPDIELKDEYMKRYEERGNDEAFIELLDNNWDSWITEIEEDDRLSTIKLDEGEYMSDILQENEVLDFLFEGDNVDDENS